MEKLVDESCKGCVHLSFVDGVGEVKTPVCLYILNREKRRPCPPGEGCTEKQIGKKGPVGICIH